MVRPVTVARFLLAGAALLSSTACRDGRLVQSRVEDALDQAGVYALTPGFLVFNADLTVYNRSGKNPQSGTTQSLVGPTPYVRHSLFFPFASQEFLTVGNDTSYLSHHGNLPQFADDINGAVTSPNSKVPGGWSPYVGMAVTPVATPADLPGRWLLECFTITAPVAKPLQSPALLPRTETKVCLDRRNNDLRAIVIDSDDPTIGHKRYLRDEIYSINGQRIARRVRLQVNGVTVAEASVTQLDYSPAKPDAFLPTPDMMRSTPGRGLLSEELIPERILRHDPPLYPPDAKAAGVHGDVIFWAVLGKDGHVRSLTVAGSPDPRLTEAATKAVMKWTFKPFQGEKQADEVETRLTVPFAAESNGKP